MFFFVISYASFVTTILFSTFSLFSVDELDHASSLERAAHITLTLVEDLHAANESLTAALKSEADTEQAQFLVKLAPRVRRLESDATQCLSQRMELFLQRIQDKAEDDSEEDLLLMLGHCMRGLALLGRSRDVENIFARTAIMPVVRSKVSMGRLDEGGSRGECAGLFSLLDDMATTIAATFGPVLRMAETMFDVGSSTDVDMLTAGVWVPIATALMADPGIKMAIFSPGIASILQANYTALDMFLSELAGRMLSPGQQTAERVEKESPDEMNGLAKYYQPAISPERIQQAQDRIYNHPKTAEFTKKWNLPIYYQLRFGECCTRLNKAVDQTKREGWIADVFTGSEEQGDKLRNSVGFELTLFLELYDILLGLWRPDVILLPLSNRFLRGAIQLLGRVVSFISEGMEGTILFGEEPVESESSENGGMDASGSSQHQPPPMIRSRKPYCWGESEEDVAAVAWELTVLESCVRHDYASVIAESLSRGDSSEDGEQSELRRLVEEVLKEASDEITPVIDKAWNGYVVDILTAKCSAPLAAVKGVAATYRMTNRPPPTQASPFVATILRPLKEFGQEFADRTPDRVGAQWKQQIVATVSDRYAAAVRELLATVQRTEAALKSRKTRRAAAGGMSDGEKVKLQVHLDCAAFSTSVREAGVDPAAVPGLSELAELTAEGEKLLHHQN
jgi:hypothetical protein